MICPPVVPPFQNQKWWDEVDCPPVVPPFQNQKWGDEEDCPPVVPPFQNQKWGDEEVCTPTMDALLGVVSFRGEPVQPIHAPLHGGRERVSFPPETVYRLLSIRLWTTRPFSHWRGVIGISTFCW